MLPAAQRELPYADWAKLVGGLMRDTPLGTVVAVRSEQERDIIRNMTPEQRCLRQEWTTFCAGQAAASPSSEKEQLRQMDSLEKMLAGLFGR